MTTNNADRATFEVVGKSGRAGEPIVTQLRMSFCLLAVLAFASSSSAQQLMPSVGASGPGLQPQINTSPYAQFNATPAAFGINPFVGPVAYPAFRPAPRLGPRPVALAPPPPPVVNNPAVFNRGAAVPFPLPVPPAGLGVAPARGVAFNPLFVVRPGATSAYYVPPIAARPPAAADETDPFGLPRPGSLLIPVTGSASGESGVTHSPVSGGFDTGVVAPHPVFPDFPWTR